MLNTSSSLYKAEWLDLVFKNRNKNYGAYVLRAESAGTTLRSLFIAAVLFISIFVAPLVYKHFNPGPADIKNVDRVVDIRNLTTLPPPVKELVPDEKKTIPKKQPAEKLIKMVKLPSNPVVVDEPVLVDPPTIEDIENAAIGPVTQSGTETDLVPVSQTGTEIGAGNSVDNEIYDYNSGIEAFPEFEGGMKAWAKFIQRNLRYPVMAQENGVQGKVFVSFVVETDGSVSNVTLIKGIGAGCDEEAIRVIQKSPKWKPGRQNNRSVRVRYNMPLSFAISQ